ncbi:hypothetical protein FTW19_13565 [Terriglobus albidus]|uniref:Uncharacterized protein n=1 Tax=Terriglobus albidus TaxID=1592106 RepID=A0A5B9EF41_9BACT|nr:hypothetical protein [Terriglobus albidus]QEE28937.1 hypothetical protein FTW19_13565 [Terriglobus albidus]
MKLFFAASMTFLLVGQATEVKELDLTKPVAGLSSLGVPGGTMGSSTPSFDYELPFRVINKSCRLEAGGDAIVELSMVNHGNEAYSFPISIDQRTTHRGGTHNRRIMYVEAQIVGPKDDVTNSKGLYALYSSTEDPGSATQIAAGEQVNLRLRFSKASSLLTTADRVRITFGETELKDASFFIARRSNTIQSTTTACPISAA